MMWKDTDGVIAELDIYENSSQDWVAINEFSFGNTKYGVFVT